MLEKQIEAKMRDYVMIRGGLFYKFKSPGTSGVPDRILVTPDGVVRFVEVKTESGKLSALQTRQIRALEARGANVVVVYGLDMAMAFLGGVFAS